MMKIDGIVKHSDQYLLTSLYRKLVIRTTLAKLCTPGGVPVPCLKTDPNANELKFNFIAV